MSIIPNKKRIAIIGGGTNTYISNHLALSAPAYGTTAKKLFHRFATHPENKMEVDLYVTKMVNQSNPKAPDTPEEVEILVDNLIANPDIRVIIFNVAMVDYKPEELHVNLGITDIRETIKDFGKYNRRLSSANPALLALTPHEKIIQKIRKERKDILLVGFKTTCGATKEEQFQKGLKLCKDASANIVFVNDVDKDRITSINNINHRISYNLNLLKTETDPKVIDKLQERVSQLKDNQLTLQNNGLVTPEESSYWYNTRDEALDGLVQMVLDRSHLHFTRSTVVDSETVPWNVRKTSSTLYTTPIVVEPKKREYTPNPIIPETFRVVFDWVRSQGAYKKGPTGATVGHFGIKLGPNEFLTSKRKTDFNKIEEVGLVRVITDDPDDVFGYKHFFEDSDYKEKANEFYRLRESLKYAEDDKHIFDINKRITELQSKYNFFEKRNNDKVIAFGAKPSVGGQSQRSLFQAFPDLNCIVHFHCPLRPESRKLFTTTPQFSYECGSYECIASNITGFQEYKVSETHSIWAGHMDYHGPNIVFNSNIDPQLVINFINEHWDLIRKTDGLSEDNK